VVIRNLQMRLLCYFSLNSCHVFAGVVPSPLSQLVSDGTRQLPGKVLRVELVHKIE